jgi:hypothetical protein
MPKFIFILFLFFCSLHAFSQKGLPNTKIDKPSISDKFIMIEKEKMETVVIKNLNETEIEMLMSHNLCEILALKVSDLLNESMLKKLKANV